MTTSQLSEGQTAGALFAPVQIKKEPQLEAAGFLPRPFTSSTPFQYSLLAPEALTVDVFAPATLMVLEIKKLTEKGDLEKLTLTKKAAKLDGRRPLHVDNVCHIAEERTIIQSGDGSRKDRLKKGEEFSVDERPGILDKFAEADWETSEGLLKEYGHILMDGYANSYFMLEALDAEMRGERSLMMRLGRQGQILSQIHQLAEPMKRPPRDLVPRFFERFEHETSRAAFEEGVNHFTTNIIQRAVVKKEAAAKKKAEAETEGLEKFEAKPLVEAMHDMPKEDRMGPGGLDPVEVFASLPEVLQRCFKEGDVELLKQVAQEMPEEDVGL
ncbi:Cdc37 [Symbiodinium natans]|uniref:Cdc37 protein n=1 Tax=Symbiodinium natans TaxID=878477 RepID=A0A812ILP5_9DINO|nr:Cdc37 [Symbiodinium natans]